MFCSIFLAVITKSISNYTNGNESMNELTLSQEATAVVAQYKIIIREQDVKMQMMNEKLKSVDQEKDLLMVKLFCAYAFELR